jgi:hypothetical protein
MRQLVTIQTIKSLEPIPGKDRILYASFENTGWKVIVASTMRAGDKVVFVEADSVLPVHPAFEFLRPRCHSPRWNGFIVRNMRMAGLYSTGLALPLSVVGQFDPFAPFAPFDAEKLKDGHELTDFFKVRKYDPEQAPREFDPSKKRHPAVKWFWALVYKNRYLSRLMEHLAERRRDARWPVFLSKTDETRAQALSYIYDQYKGLEFYATEKLDGSSCTYAWRKNKFYVCSRNQRLKYKRNKKSCWWMYAQAAMVESRMRMAARDLGHDVCVQGELIGPGIQGNKYGLGRLNFKVFQVQNLDSGGYLSRDEMVEFCGRNGFCHVPMLETFSFQFGCMDELLEYSKGMSELNPYTLREGVVLRPSCPMPPGSKQSNMCSFKVINPDFDVKHSAGQGD